ncbi:MAG: TetR/AcrR family transcriptional regulator [Faecalicatena sp.]|uniref:TetR/AcrR family transcriptional regulator n=1 Tax=Faecalicatena sp. TaxID=2005360 RepID=UPI0025907722|nr:TetR/AcrR family transcriptional regulator [Faecalicatena sp.]MCI6465327.1 TetR/AcrR family transcriptional regulator [Faecalicatena sp.]MDY5617511.1 TetR/AcrR family transcriptional regulator [Lachnospiraceae bacterium]
MGKVDDNKQQKLESLFKSAYDLFLTQGISKTSIHDIVQKAGVAKGTFYLYFKDKYEIRDRLIAKTAGRLFMSAHDALEKAQIPVFEDKIIFIVDYVLDEMAKNKPVLRFISKNLSWGIFRQAITKNEADADVDVMGFFNKLVQENPDIRLKAPETMLFLIIELASSTSYSTILENDPISYEELKPYLNESIRAIIRNHVTA